MPDRPIEALEDAIGRTAVTAEGLRIEAGKVEEFANAIRDPSPVYHDDDAAADRGFDRRPAPPTFVLTDAFPRYRPAGTPRELTAVFDLGLDSNYSVLGEREFEFERPVQVGDDLTATTTLTDVYQRDGGRGGTMTFAEFETEYRTGDELVVTVRATAIELGSVPDEQGGERA